MSSWRACLARFAGVALMISLAFGNTATGMSAEGGFAATQGRHFVGQGGRTFMVWGVNYVGHDDRSWTMWEDGKFDAALIGDDLSRALAAGADVVRIFVRNPLPREITAGHWEKLDTVVSLARQRGLRLLITLNDYGETDLGKVADTAGAIAARYAAEQAVFGYDLKNEPHLFDLIVAQYPGGTPPLFGETLVRAYGERANQAQVNAWRVTDEGRKVIPSRLSAKEAYYAATGYRIYQEFVAAGGDWVVAHDYTVSTLDFIASSDAARWRTLLNVLNGTVAAWLKPQLGALRAVDSAHLVTVGYNDPVLAQLPANRALSFVSLHRFPTAGVKPMQLVLNTLGRLQQVFPDKPVLLEEFGYSNVDRAAATTAIDEGAQMLALWQADLGGGLKWSLNDVAQGWNPREQHFGLYDSSDNPKPAVDGMRALAEYFSASRPGGSSIRLESDGSALKYTFSAPDALIVGGRQYQDERLSYSSATPVQVSVVWSDGDAVIISATGRAVLTINPRALLGDASVRTDFALMRTGAQPVPFDLQGGRVTFTAEGGERYRLKLTRGGVDAKVEIVWPHGNRPVKEAEQANVGVYLFERGGGRPYCGAGAGPVRLWRSVNNGVEEAVAVGSARPAGDASAAFTAWDFNNVSVAPARDPTNKLYFRLSVDGLDTRSGVWSHGADARTYFPNPDVPTKVMTTAPDAVDAKIEVVWPHGNLPVDRAEKVNIASYVFQHGTTAAVPLSWNGTVRLWRSLNNGVAEQVAVGQMVTKRVGQLNFPAWEFNNVDVSAARDTLNKYYFRLSVDGLSSYSNVWSHGKDGRTYFPKVDTPAAGCS